MSQINGWLYSMFVISLTVGIAEAFAPVGQAKKYIKYAVSLTALIILITPVAGILRNITNLMNGLENVATGAITAAPETEVTDAFSGIACAGADGIAEYISERISEKYPELRGSIRAELGICDDRLSEITITSVKIIITTRAESPSLSYAKKAEEIKKFAAELTGCGNVTAVYEDDTR